MEEKWLRQEMGVDSRKAAINLFVAGFALGS